MIFRMFHVHSYYSFEDIHILSFCLQIKKFLTNFLTKLQTSARDIPKTLANITNNFSMILIYVKMITLTELHFCRNVPLNDPCGLSKTKNQNYWCQ